MEVCKFDIDEYDFKSSSPLIDIVKVLVEKDTPEHQKVFDYILSKRQKTQNPFVYTLTGKFNLISDEMDTGYSALGIAIKGQNKYVVEQLVKARANDCVRQYREKGLTHNSCDHNGCKQLYSKRDVSGLDLARRIYDDLKKRDDGSDKAELAKEILLTINSKAFTPREPVNLIDVLKSFGDENFLDSVFPNRRNPKLWR